MATDLTATYETLVSGTAEASSVLERSGAAARVARGEFDACTRVASSARPAAEFVELE